MLLRSKETFHFAPSSTHKKLQKRSSRRDLRKRRSENKQQIYSTLMPKCDFNKVALQHY